jgi:hypothetical protein
MFQKRRIGFAGILSLVLLGSCATGQARADVIVVPNALATTEGNSSAGVPTNPFRFMQIMDATQFAAFSQPILITQIAFRPDVSQASPASQSFNVQLFLSTTSQSVAGLSPTFAANLGPDNTLVFGGPITLTTANLPGPGTAKQFDLTIPFTTPFYYDPRAGNLLFDFQVFSAGPPSLQEDAVAGSPITSSVFFNGSATNPTGTLLATFGLVNQFTVQPVPEPSTFFLVSLAVLGLLGPAWRRRKRVVQEM